MKPRVLFVDDDPLVLSSIRRQILLKLPDVELVFCESAKRALQLSLEKPPSIVFSDVRMPEMSGPDFLNQIAELHGNAVRFALTGQSEAEQLERTFYVAHQVLSKPTDSSTLLKLIKTSLVFQSLLAISPIESFLLRKLDGQGSFSTPTDPTEIFSLIRRDDISLATIAETVEQDMVLKARLLAVANSASVSPARPVTTVLAAVSLLGLRVVGVISSGHVIQRKLGQDALVSEEIRRSLDYGTMLAFQMNRAIQAVNLPEELYNSAYLAATYYSFGRILFSSFNRQSYSDLRKECGDDYGELEKREKERFGVSQEVAGAYKLFLWGMDEDTCFAIANLTELSPNSAKIRSAIDIARSDLQTQAKASKPPSVCDTGG